MADATPVATARRDWFASLDLYRYIVGARIRSDWQYRTSFFTFAASQAVVNVLDLLALFFVVDLVPSLGGWSRAEVGLLYALATVPFGLSDVVVSPVERTSVYVRSGEMDRLLLRPVPALIQIAALQFELRRLGKVVPSLAVLVWAMAAVDVAWTPWRLAVLAGALACGTVIYSALWILTAAASFWLVASQEATNSVTYGGEYASQYPLHLYRPWIRAVLGWIVPLAFVAYVPAQTLLDAANPLGLPAGLVYAAPVVAGLLMVVALAVWRTGIRHYQSTGS